MNATSKPQFHIGRRVMHITSQAFGRVQRVAEDGDSVRVAWDNDNTTVVGISMLRPVPEPRTAPPRITDDVAREARDALQQRIDLGADMQIQLSADWLRVLREDTFDDALRLDTIVRVRCFEDDHLTVHWVVDVFLANGQRVDVARLGAIEAEKAAEEIRAAVARACRQRGGGMQ